MSVSELAEADTVTVPVSAWPLDGVSRNTDGTIDVDGTRCAAARTVVETDATKNPTATAVRSKARVRSVRGMSVTTLITASTRGRLAKRVCDPRGRLRARDMPGRTGPKPASMALLKPVNAGRYKDALTCLQMTREDDELTVNLGGLPI